MLLLIDNYDSFTWNLRQYFEQLGETVSVFRNDQINIKQIDALSPDYLVISPGPGTPKNAGISMAVIERFAGKIPMLGVCLGHQAIAEVFGANIVKAEKPMHGKMSHVKHNVQGLFQQLPNPLTVIRYHSLVVEEKSLNHELLVDAKVENNEIMAIRHKTLPIFGVQFHPESVLTQAGHQLLANFLR